MRGIIGIAVLLGGLLLLVEACVHADPAKSPARPEGPWFDHALHAEKGLACIDCHGEEEAGFMAMPELDFCMECHEDIDGEQPQEKRASAFYDEEGQGRWVHAGALSEEIIFDHASHVGSAEGDCLACHRVVAESNAIPVGAGVTMEACMACHEAQAPQYNACASCHEEIRQDRRPPSHHQAWTAEHGRLARLGSWDAMPRDCSWCHTRSSCNECHRAEKPRDHTNLFRLHGHAAMASIDRDRCRVCHTTDSCFECHKDAIPRSHRGSFGAPFNRHCFGCHLPLAGPAEEGCAVCHRGTPSHALAPPRPGNPPHMTTNSAACRECHMPMPHPDNGQSCLLCHK